nr:MAG TPA: hypothetical protein [Caudoviricetes sp.]
MCIFPRFELSISWEYTKLYNIIKTANTEKIP